MNPQQFNINSKMLAKLVELNLTQAEDESVLFRVLNGNMTRYRTNEYVAPAKFVPSGSDWFKADFDSVLAAPTTTEYRGHWPLENFRVDQTTPTFVAPYPHTGPTNITFTWEVREQGTDEVVSYNNSATPGRHVLRWGQELKRGTWYEYRVKRGDTNAWSDWRPFFVRKDATSWIFKPMDQTLADMKAKAHPRAKPLDLDERVMLYKTGGVLRAHTTAAITQFTNVWAPLAIPEPSNTNGKLYTVNKLMTEYLIQVNCWWLEQTEGTGTYRTEALRRGRQMITGALAFTPAGLPNSMSTDQQAIRTLVVWLSAFFDLWYADLTSGDKIDILALADTKIDLLHDNMQSTTLTLDGILGFNGLWRSTTYTNRLYLCCAAACFVGESGMTAQMIENTERAAQRLEYNLNWWHNYGTNDGINAESEYYATTDGFFEPNLVDMASGLIDRDVYTARPHIREWVEASAVMFPYTSSARLYPFSDSGDTSTGSIVKNMGCAFKLPPTAVTPWLDLAFPTQASYASTQAGQATSFLNRGLRPTYPNVRRLGTFFPDAGLASSTDGRPSGVEFWARSSPLGSHTHFHADHNSYLIGHGGKTLVGFPGAYKWAGASGVNAASRLASCKSIAHNTVGMDLVDYDGGGGGTYMQCLGQQRWDQQLGGLNTHLMKTQGAFRYEKETSGFKLLVGDAADAYWNVGYEMTKSLRAWVHIRPGLIIVIDACDSAVAHTWHHQIKSAVLPTYSAPWVTIADSQGTLKFQAPYASGTVAFDLGNQGWWDAQTPASSPPAAPYNNAVSLPSATTMRLALVYQVGTEAVTSITASNTADVITVNATYGSRAWVVKFNCATGELTLT